MKKSTKILLALLCTGVVLVVAGLICCFFDLILGVVFIALGIAVLAASRIVSFKVQSKLQATEEARTQAERKKQDDENKRTPPDRITVYDGELFLAYRYNHIPVKGIKRNNIKLGEWLDVSPASSFSDNETAVAIEFNGAAVGYLTDPTVCEITYRFDKSKTKHGVLAVVESEPLSTVTVAFYKEKDSITKYKGKHFVLVGNKRDEVQRDLSLMSVGDNVSIRFDEGKEKFVVSEKIHKTFLGYIRENKYMTEDESYSGCIYDISTDEDDFYKVEVVIPDSQFDDGY